MKRYEEGGWVGRGWARGQKERGETSQDPSGSHLGDSNAISFV